MGRVVATRVMDRTLEAQAWMLSSQDAFALTALPSLRHAPRVPMLRRGYIPSG